MMRTRLILVPLLASLLFLGLAVPALAQGDAPGKLIFGGDYTLENGQTLRGDLGVIGGNATLREGSAVYGDVLVTGGNLRVGGSIFGDIAVFGGNVTLTSSAQVDGDIASFGGNVQRAEGARISGDIIDGEGLTWPGLRALPMIPGTPIPPAPPQAVSFQTSPADWVLVQFLRLIRAVGVTMALTALALVVALFWPKGVERIGTTATEQPFLAFGLGLAGWIVSLGAVVVMLITICLIPLALLFMLVLVAAVLLSVISAGWLVGRKLVALLKIRNTSTVLEAASGTLLLVFTYFLLGILACCVDVIFALVVVSLGSGAIILTRFGTRSYRPAVSVAASAQPATPATPVAALPAAQVEEIEEADADADDDVIHLPSPDE